MKNSFRKYLSEKSMIAVWFKTPRWVALCLPIIDILYRMFGGLIGILFGLFHLTPIGFIYSAWDGFIVSFDGRSFIEGFTGAARSSNPLFTIISFDLLLLAVFYLLFCINKNKSSNGSQ